VNLNEIQQNLKAPKAQRNNFGNYNYRSCEDILQAVKPMLDNGTLTLTDDIREVAGKPYVVAKATLTDGEGNVTSCTGIAREAEVQKGMMPAQISGATSSYARKYALNGLFAIDDTKDDDATNEHKQPKKASDGKRPKDPTDPTNPADMTFGI
jgi:hypothetical protein